ncbi:MAG: methylamine utilization protein [Alphaproteobacteria bacterium]|nr:methylamine utilization protein [Alphaproteobacteria bacterium]
MTGFPACAATLHLAVYDSAGRPAPNAVVTLTPLAGSASAPHLPVEAIIDQRKETFIPLVTIIRRGGHALFTNNDTTRHQVYSFSPIKQFEFEVDEGRRSEPVVFDKAGVASIGCNIHDQMIAYVYVADAPWAVLTNENGRAEAPELPTGDYRAVVWHPQLPLDRPPPATTVTVKGSSDLSLALPLAIIPSSRHLHMGIY